MYINFEANKVEIDHGGGPKRHPLTWNSEEQGVLIRAELNCCDFCSYPQLDHKSPGECLMSICKEIYRNIKLRWKWRNE